MFASNASTLILLAKVSALVTFLEETKVEIPEIMFNEIKAVNSYDAILIKKQIEQKKVAVKETRKQVYQEILNQFRLDEGEAAAYALYNNKVHKAILTDDKELIKLCKIEQIKFLCAMAILVRLFEKGRLSKEDAINKIDKLYLLGRYSKELYSHFKSEVS